MDSQLWVYVIGSVALVLGFGAFFGAPYVPTKRKDVKRLFKETGVIDEGDTLLDLGSGDGLVLRAARQMGARAVGYEINIFFYALSRVLSWRDSGVAVHLANAWVVPFPEDTTVVYIFSVNKDAKRLEKVMQREANRLRKPLTLICYGNPLPGREAASTFEAYTLYVFQPLHLTQP